MSDPVSSPDPAPGAAPAPAPRTRGWVKAVLALSLALNLVILGLVGGAFLRGDRPGGGDRDFGLGPLADALSREDRRALREAFAAAFPEASDTRAALRGDFSALLAALRAEPLDPAALDAAFAAIAARNADLLERGRSVIADYLKAMGPEARAAFADRLERALARGDRRDRWHGDDDHGRDGGKKD